MSLTAGRWAYAYVRALESQGMGREEEEEEEEMQQTEQGVRGDCVLDWPLPSNQ